MAFGADTATHLYAAADGAPNCGNGVPIGPLPPRRVQINDVNPDGAGLLELAGHFSGIVSVRMAFVVATFMETHALPVQNVDSGNDDHVVFDSLPGTILS